MEFGLKSSKPVHKPRLIQAMKEKRLDHAKRLANWDMDMRKKVLFQTGLPCSSLLFEDIGFGGLSEHVTRESALPLLLKTNLAK